MQTKHTSQDDEQLSVGEAALILGISPDTMRRWEKSGRIASRRTPTGHRRYRRGDVEGLLDTEASA